MAVTRDYADCVGTDCIGTQYAVGTEDTVVDPDVIKHIDDDGTIYDVSLNQTNVGGNNNKFYRIQILVSKSARSFATWTRWGRVGERGTGAPEASLPAVQAGGARVRVA